MNISAGEAKRVADSFCSSKLEFYKRKCIPILEKLIKDESAVGGYQIRVDAMSYLEGEDYGAMHSRKLALRLKDELVLELVSNGFRCTGGLNFTPTDFCVTWE